MSQQPNQAPPGSERNGNGYGHGSGYGYGPGSAPGYGQAPGFGAAPGPGYGAGMVQPRPHVGPGQAMKNWLAGLVNFRGRASRSEYWWVALFVTVVPSIIFAVIMMIGMFAFAAETTTHYSYDQYGYSAHATATPSPGFIAVCVILWLILFVLGLSTLGLSARRLHDANFSALFLLLLLAPAGSIVILVMTLLPGSPAAGRFDESQGGPVPYGSNGYPPVQRP